MVYMKIIDAVSNANDFKKQFDNPDKSIENMMDSNRKKQVLENRARFRPIIEAIIVLRK